MSPRIEDYALIGDGETAALVSRTGSIDWLCWPRFDSGACFAALLGNFVLTYSASHLPPPRPIDAELAFTDTQKFWLDWARRCRFEGPWDDTVTRSLITLKALIYQPTGGIVAAPTTSLPERLGGTRYWDYRYCWPRDATFTLLSLMDAGYFEEAERWRDWLVQALAGAPAQAQIMYGLGGERRLPEWEVDWLAGHA